MVTLDVDRDVSGDKVDWVRVTFMLLCLDGILRLWLVHLQIRFSMWSAALQLSCCHVSEHADNKGHRSLWNEVNLIARGLQFCTRKVKEAIYIRLHLNNVNGDSGIEILEAWMPTIKKHNSRRAVRQRIHQSQPWNSIQSQLRKTAYRWPVLNRSHSAKKISSLQLKRLDRHLKWPDRKTNDETIYWQQK